MRKQDGAGRHAHELGDVAARRVDEQRLGFALWAVAARAHKPSDSYLTLRADGAQLGVQWDIALRALGLDADSDGALTWGEVRARQDAIAAYALARLRIDGDGVACTSRPIAHLIDHHTDGAYRSWLYQRCTLVVGSSLIAMLAGIWLLERALDLRLLPS